MHAETWNWLYSYICSNNKAHFDKGVVNHCNIIGFGVVPSQGWFVHEH
jgi:hypothetical protein